MSLEKDATAAQRDPGGQHRKYPKMFAKSENQHLAVVRLRSPRATSQWLSRVVAAETTSP